ncbi:hypothetical protein Taro_030759 [Colocasia esculenta]|uniref:Uncharacterized protein n=1 Tax=Colocasia esculenta TaxID=4460 RepID=A0A843VM74_COLES|nr:hypothetical protein [Colocasia esculenta]
MCMLCVVQKWSRRVIGVLPWLVIPLIGLWGLSHLLAPGLQFEITSPRMACVVVLLVTVFWYEVLLPRVTAYWARRSVRVREQQRIQALELQKLRKAATRKCRNCRAIYREQNPGGGKFMCSYCGHVSRRPVLDLPGSPGRSGFIRDLFGNSSWFCSQDCSADGSENYGGPFPLCWAMDGEEQFLTEKSYSRVAFFIWKLLLSFFSCVKRFYGRVLSLASYAEDDLSDTEQKGLLRKGENRVNSQEDKVEKARRKVEEKKQARLEKEMLEEEERRQKEEVARLIEERRKFRGENLEAEKEVFKGRASDEERDNRKRSESEKRSRDKRKEKDKNSSRSNSDGEGHGKRGISETEKKDEFVRKIEAKKGDASNPRTESQKVNIDIANSVKDVSKKSKHLDRTRGKVSHNSAASIAKSGKLTGALADPMQRRECHAAGHVNGRSLSCGDPKMIGTTYAQHTQTGTLKRSWHQLFTSPSAGSPFPENDTERLDRIGRSEVQVSELLDQKVSGHPLHKQMQIKQSSCVTAHPFTSSYSTGGSASLVSEPKVPLAGDPGHNFAREGVETFEDPCYAPDPITLIGPVSESLDNFIDAGSGLTADFGSDDLYIHKNVSDCSDTKKPSPIEAPMSKLRLFEDRQIASGSCIPKSQVHGDSPGDESNVINQGTWQMWSSPLCRDLLSLVATPANSLSAPTQNKGSCEEIIYPPARNAMASHAVEENNILQSAFNHSPIVHVANCQNDGMMSSATPLLNENDPWLQESVLYSFPGDAGNHFSLGNFNGNPSPNDVAYESANRSAAHQSPDI